MSKLNVIGDRFRTVNTAQPYPNDAWCVGCSPDDCHGCGVPVDHVGDVTLENKPRYFKPMPACSATNHPEDEISPDMYAAMLAECGPDTTKPGERSIGLSPVFAMPYGERTMRDLRMNVTSLTLGDVEIPIMTDPTVTPQKDLAMLREAARGLRIVQAGQTPGKSVPMNMDLDEVVKELKRRKAVGDPDLQSAPDPYVPDPYDPGLTRAQRRKQERANANQQGRLNRLLNRAKALGVRTEVTSKGKK